ncbi:MAG: hypothetical protein RLZZ56_549 [Actinomycetota bacterium]|jgi:hypothetical protein
MRIRIQALIAAFGLALGLITPALNASANIRSATVDLGDNVFQLDKCQSPEELDCIQGVEVINSDGTSVSATRILNPVIAETSAWDVSSNFFTGRLITTVHLSTPEHVIPVLHDGVTHYGGALSVEPFIYSPNGAEPLVPEGLLFKYSIRTSWLKPQNVQLVADKADFSQTPIPGGNLWVFTGSPVAISTYTGGWDSPEKQNHSARADADVRTFRFGIGHAGVDALHSYFDPTCSEFGYTVQAFNSNEAGNPEWNTQNQSLDLNIYAPHTTTLGELNKGFFKLWTTDQYINCRWPQNTLSDSRQLTAQIRNTDGSFQTSVMQILHENGKIFLNLEEFHYSAPTIRIKGINPLKKIKYASTPSLSGIAKIGQTLTVKVGKWDKGSKLDYTWFRNGKRIIGAVKSKYKLSSLDRKKKLYVSVTGRKLGYKHITKKSRSVSVR